MKFLPQDVRRATLDDLPQLIELWQMEKLPVEVLDKRFTEFQVVADASGRIVGAVGMQLSDKQHSGPWTRSGDPPSSFLLPSRRGFGRSAPVRRPC